MAKFNVVVHFKDQKTYLVEAENADQAEEEAVRRFHRDGEGTLREFDRVEDAVEKKSCAACGKAHEGKAFTEACGYASPTRYAVLDPASIINEEKP